MKEFIIEDFTINNDNSIDIDYYFYSEIKKINFTEEQIREVIDCQNIENLGFTLTEYLHDIFSEDDCIVLLKYYIREYKDKRKVS